MQVPCIKKAIQQESIYRFIYENNLHPIKGENLRQIILHLNYNPNIQAKRTIHLTALTLELIANQRSKYLRTKQSLAAYKIRKGVVTGVLVTLRKEKMYLNNIIYSIVSIIFLLLLFGVIILYIIKRIFNRSTI